MAAWAVEYTPTEGDLRLAERSLRDTVAVAFAALDEPVVAYGRQLGTAGGLAVAAHLLDFDDLHLPSTSHISAVIVPVVIAAGGDARAYLAGAGVMARLGTRLGWEHYSRGWHTTCTAGAPAAAVAAAVVLGLNADETAHAMALALPAAGGEQRAFGTDGKALQVGMAAEAGWRAARLVGAGARGDPASLDQWLALVGAGSSELDLSGPAVPGGLAIKLFPCCYAMQRPIHAVRMALGGDDPKKVAAVLVRTPAAAVQPLIHHRPRTGLQAKFSMEYAIATAVLDGFPALSHFTDEAVRRPAASRIMASVIMELDAGGTGLLDGTCAIEIQLASGNRQANVDQPPGAPARPPGDDDLAAKAASCGPRAAATVGVTWSDAQAIGESFEVATQ
jgi:2-methylcitrate dehydratase PrpD